eukprot:TRINITY_DN3537_c0_g1_i1.p1 TRINITY_DN3537_c0_g1~~TRINITY_DN3537_c0_g1_i1.p1  ORF type:complete len:230 (+),score=34.64 TRINITY_DN3537_c0_g1_i1:74-763(+)
MGLDLEQFKELMEVDAIHLEHTGETMDDAQETISQKKSIMSFRKFDIHPLSWPNGKDKEPALAPRIFSIREEISHHFSISFGQQCRTYLVKEASNTPILYLHKPFKIGGGKGEAFDPNLVNIGCVKSKFSMLERKLEIRDAQQKPLYKIKAPKKLITRDQSFTVYKADGTEVALFNKVARKTGVDIQITFPKDASLEHRCLFLLAAVFAENHWFELDGTLKVSSIKIVG